MAYSKKTRELRQCVGVTAAGARCRAWARWGSDDQLCSSHTIRKRGKPENRSRGRSKAKCECRAYDWPHKPGGGYCRWPDEPMKDARRQQVCDPGRGGDEQLGAESMATLTWQ
jgi:hypothetical protein